MTSNARRGRRLVRVTEAWERLGVARSKFYADFAPRLTIVELGGKARAVYEDELDALMASLPRAEVRPVAKRKRDELADQ